MIQEKLNIIISIIDKKIKFDKMIGDKIDE